MWEGLSTTLSGDLVVLEPLAEHHREPMRVAASFADVWRLQPLSGQPLETFGVWFDEAFDAWFDLARAALEDGREAPFATIERASSDVVGCTRFMELRPEHRGVHVGWTWLTPAVWQTGVNIEAKLLMFAHAFERLGCVRVDLKTDVRNARSRAAMAALPAQEEGVFRQHMVRLDGTLRDSIWFSVIDREWPAVRANLERRLAAKRSS
jgi:RimJ/RimL family protein N-acetyltransferase